MAKVKTLLPDMHMGIWGKSGSGKSYMASELHRVASRSIYFNVPKKPGDDYAVKGYDADRNTEQSELKKAMRQKMKVRYSPHWKDDVASKELRAVYEAVKNASGHKYLFVDEAHRFSGDGSSLQYAIRDGRGFNVHVLPMSQFPKDVPTSTHGNIDDHMIFKLKKQQKPWFRTMGLPFEAIRQYTKQNYHFVIYNEEYPEPGFKKHRPIPFRT